MTYIAKHAANRDEFLGSEVFDHEYCDPQVCTGDAQCPEIAVAPYMPTVERYVSTDPANDPFVFQCCGGTRPAHTSRCRDAY